MRLMGNYKNFICVNQDIISIITVIKIYIIMNTHIWFDKVGYK